MLVVLLEKKLKERKIKLSIFIFDCVESERKESDILLK